MDATSTTTMLAIGVLALLLGAAAGVAVAARRAGADRAVEPAGVADPGLGGRLEGHLAAQAAEIRRLADQARTRDGSERELWSEVSAARRALEELRILEDRRRDREAESWKVVQRLATVLAGGATKGRAGENVLREQLAELPPGILATDVRMNGKVVEYGLELPDGRRLPVDSKWTAVRELEELEEAEDPAEREALAREVERCVAARAREVAAYLDPALTAPVAVCAVPDAAFAVLRRAHADAFSRGVVIVPYGTALPVLLFLYSLVARYGAAGDVQGCLTELGGLLDTMESVLE
ncbi:MAG: DNA recombination protein RmuC, partial [Actinobacteria bacterium]|nr:DNA recombination protein RmuC [Actinomycetota bacterium]